MYQKNGLCLSADDPLNFLHELGCKEASILLLMDWCALITNTSCRLQQLGRCVDLLDSIGSICVRS